MNSDDNEGELCFVVEGQDTDQLNLFRSIVSCGAKKIEWTIPLGMQLIVLKLCEQINDFRCPTTAQNWLKLDGRAIGDNLKAPKENVINLNEDRTTWNYRKLLFSDPSSCQQYEHLAQVLNEKAHWLLMLFRK